MIRTFSTVWIILLICCVRNSYGQQEITDQASALVKTMSAPAKAKASYVFENNERFNWHFVPRDRNGVRLRDLTDTERAAVFSLLKKCLRVQGYDKVTAIVGLENVLRAVEGRGPNDGYRDPLNYHVTLFGNPGQSRWAWRFEGHHVAMNFTMVDNQLASSTPTFLGANPAIVREGPARGKQILIEESRRGFELVNSLSKAQREKAIISDEALPEIVSFNSRKAVHLSPEGLPYHEMKSEQQEMLLALLKVYVENYELGFSRKLMNKIQKAGIENLTFAWAGGSGEGVAYYYRIQGPMLLIELDNTQNNANHIHSVVRDLTNDFGDDLLREHYQKEHNSN